MKIQIKSDLHLEFSAHDISNSNNDDVLILAGDIFPITDLFSYKIIANRYRTFLENCSKRFKDVIYVLGNHCYYYGDIASTVKNFKTYCSQYPNIHVLNNDSITIDGLTFVGTTLWTNMNNRNIFTLLDAKRGMADYQVIYSNGNILTPDDTIQLFEESMHYLSEEVKKHDKVIVVTHHAPSLNSLHKKFEGNTLNGAFLNDLDDFIYDNDNILCWVHGHCHSRFDYYIGMTRVICNPRGYTMNNYTEDTEYDPDLTVTL